MKFVEICCWMALTLMFPLVHAQSSFQYLYPPEASVEVAADQAANGDTWLAADAYNDTASFFHRIWVQRLDANGTVLQSSGLFRPPSFRMGGGIKATSDNGLLVMGTVNIPLEDPDSVFVIKLDETGQINWSKGFQVAPNIHSPQGAIEMNDGSFLVYGTYSHVAFAEGIFLVKISSTGALVWSRIVNSQLNGAFMKVGGVVETETGDLWLSGSTRFNTEGSWLARLNPTGETQSVTFLNTHSLTESQPEPFAIHQRSNGDLDIFYNRTAFQSGPVLLAVHTDANGQPLQTSRFSAGSNFGEITSISPNGGGVYLAGGYMFSPGSNRSSGLVMQLDATYQLDWARRHGTSYIESLTNVFPQAGGGYTAAGFADFDSVIISPSENGLYPWLFQTENNGSIPCLEGNVSIAALDTSVSTMSYQLDNVAGPTLGDISFTNFPLTPANESVVCNTTSIDLLPADAIQLFPNPSMGTLRLESGLQGEQIVELFDLRGRRIALDIQPYSNGLELTTRYRGLAIIRVQTNEGYWAGKVLFQGE